MSWLGTRSVRIYADDDPHSDPASPPSTRRGDYAALLQRGRRKPYGDPRHDRATGQQPQTGLGQDLETAAPTAHSGEHEESGAALEQRPHAMATGAAPPCAQRDEGDRASSPADTAGTLAEAQLERIAAPYVDALITQQYRF